MTAGPSVELVLDAKAEVGESPYWDQARECLWWVDIFKGELHRWSAAEGGRRVASIGQPLGFVVPMGDGRNLAGTRDGFGVIDEDGGFTLTVPVDAERPEYRMNDGKCDAHGRLWAGTIADVDPVGGGLYRLDADGSVTQLRDDMLLPNGLGWNRAGTTMYLADSTGHRVEIWDCDPASGTLRGLHATIEIPAEQGLPDGLCVDEEDHVWVALWGGSRVQRYTPDGLPDMHVELPVTVAASCAFGGPDHGDLYITTARYSVHGATLCAQPLAGGVFRCRPGVRGLPVDVFGQSRSSGTA
jgi:sugar lactone lactonase YvrE